MGMIDTIDWGTFKLGKLLNLKSGKTTGVGLFNIVNSVAYHGKDITETYAGDPNRINYVTRSKFNNGVKCQVVDTGLYTINPAGTISFGAENADFFYQTQPYITGNKMYYIDTSNISNYTCAFVKSVLEKTFTNNFSFTDGMIPARIYDEDIKLPVDANGNPDWQYMEDYMKSIEVRVGNSLSKLESAKDTEKKQIDVNGWDKYVITDLFDLSLPKGDLQVKKVFEGTIPLVTPSNTNNGVALSIDKNSNSTLYAADTITVDMFGNVYYHEEDYFVTAHGHVNVLKPLFNINKYIGMYVSSAIKSMFISEYGFSDMCTQKVLKAETVNLPTLNGQPDWTYMEQYMRNIESKTIQTLDSFAS